MCKSQRWLLERPAGNIGGATYWTLACNMPIPSVIGTCPHRSYLMIAPAKGPDVRPTRPLPQPIGTYLSPGADCTDRPHQTAIRTHSRNPHSLPAAYSPSKQSLTESDLRCSPSALRELLPVCLSLRGCWGAGWPAGTAMTAMHMMPTTAMDMGLPSKRVCSLRYLVPSVIRAQLIGVLALRQSPRRTSF